MARGKKHTFSIPAGAHTFNRPLPCTLTDEELQAKGARAAKLEDEADELQAEINSSLKEKRAKLKETRGAARSLLREISSGTEERQVRCYEDKDVRGGELRVIRADTGEVVERRTMEPEERQEALPIDRPRRGRPRKDAADALEEAGGEA